jgi:hypothetical protein
MPDKPRTRIVFVTGASRSGTTVLSRVLGNHSRVLWSRELHYFGDLCPDNASRRLDDQEIEHLAAVLFARHARNLWEKGTTPDERRRARLLRESLAPEQRTGYGVFSAAMASLAEAAGKPIACEQTPRNVFYAQGILDNLPEASFVHLVRDPRAVVASQKNRWKMRMLGASHIPVHETIRTWVNYHPVTMARLWVSATTAGLRLADHPRFRLLRFEDLLTTPEECVSSLCDFLEIPFEREMLLVPKWGSSNVRHESDNKGLSKDVLDNWETVLTASETAIVEQMTGSLMQRLAYQPRDQSARAPGGTIRHNLSYPLHLLGVALTNPRRAVIQARAMLRGGGDR